MTELPQPPHGFEVDVRDVPIPREAFARAAAMAFQMSVKDALAHINRIADAIERKPRRHPCKSL